MDNDNSVFSDFDAILQDNRVRDSLETIAGDV